MSDQIWYAVSVEADIDAAEAVEFAFNELEALGTEIDHLRKKGAATVTVSGYFEELQELGPVAEQMQAAAAIYGFGPGVIRNIAQHQVAQTDWLAEWKKHWRPTLTEHFIIAPPWESIAESEPRTIIRIEPNMAFGTGTHETTRLCLRIIESIYKPEQSVLDVGTGTGILVIAAALIAKQGGRSPAMFACDIDADSVTIARENAELNGVGGMIEFAEGSIAADTPVYDLVCANLTLDVIVPLLPRLLNAAGRTLVLSGILQEQEPALVLEFGRLGIDNFRFSYDGEWMAAVVAR